MKKLIIILLVIIAFFSGINVGAYYNVQPIIVFNTTDIPLDGFVRVEPTINFTTVHLVGDCKEITFDITIDQAYSIYNGIEGTTGVRPLTHDIMRDVIETFDIKLLQVRIDRFEDEVYYATMFMQRDNRLLELDARPSDSIALALRMNVPIYFKKTLLERGRDVCG